MRIIEIFDTTLRDGEQSPGASLNKDEKLRIAKQLERLGVDFIEAGFPVASEEDFKAVKEIAGSVNVGVCALARCDKKDIDTAWSAIKNAKKPRIHIFMSTSKIHLEKQFKITQEEALTMSVDAVRLAKSYCNSVEFSPMDATRTDKKFLYKILEEVINAGADVINIPDTVGYAQPFEFGELIKSIRENVKGIEGVKISVHCHDDLGLAVANSLEAIKNGAEQVECTINGIGERAGNAALEEIAVSLLVRKDFFNATTNLNLEEIFKTSELVSILTGFAIQKNKAVVGENAFSHESGIHQQGLLKNNETYEIINPGIIGRKSEIILGKHSGRHAVEKVLKEQGFLFKRIELEEITRQIKSLADAKKEINKMDILNIANNLNKQSN